MSYIYITEQGSKISVEGGYCTVTSPDEMKRLIPIETIEYVSLFGNINITTPALQMFMKNNITVTLYSKTGAYFGRVMSNENVNILRQRKISTERRYRIQFEYFKADHRRKNT